MIKVKLVDVIEAIEFHADEMQSFINLKTGEICSITDEAIRIVENDTDHPEWQKNDIEIAKNYLQNPDDYLLLPSQHDADEYQIMEDFANTLNDEKITGQLLITLQGQGAFRRFKDSVKLFGVIDEWYKFRDERYKQFAIQWCEDNEVALQDE